MLSQITRYMCSSVHAKKYALAVHTNTSWDLNACYVNNFDQILDQILVQGKYDYA